MALNLGGRVVLARPLSSCHPLLGIAMKELDLYPEDLQEEIEKVRVTLSPLAAHLHCIY